MKTPDGDQRSTTTGVGALIWALAKMTAFSMSKSSDSTRQLLKDFTLLQQRFTSLEIMAEALRAYEGFENLNRATLSRWLAHPTKRARAALEILNARRPPALIRIAENKTLSVIPSSMLQWDVEEGTPHGLLVSRYDMKPEVHATPHGDGSFEVLASGHADIAMIPGDLIARLPESCARLCALSKVYIAGISTKPLTSAFDLRNKRFPVLAGSSFVARLSFESRNWGFDLVPPLVLRHYRIAFRLCWMDERSVSQDGSLS